MAVDSSPGAPQSPAPDRRSFLEKLSSLAMTAGLAAGYGTLALLAGRFLYPAQKGRTWLFVAPASRIPPGGSLKYRSPAGSTIVLTRRSRALTREAFRALSSRCPHLGCQVHWEPQNRRFFCPCHNGVFNPEGKAIGGPPGKAGQSLPVYPLKVEQGLLYIGLPPSEAAMGRGKILPERSFPQGPGHDPCLEPRGEWA